MASSNSLAETPLKTANTLATMPRQKLVEILESSGRARNEWIRRMVIQGRRVDILAQEVLGYKMVPAIHMKIARHQLAHKKSLTLIYRGAGKTTIGTITKAIHYILCDRGIRIMIASKTLQNASDFLKEIKQHFETNEKLIEIFGDYVGHNRWSDHQIEVKDRGKPMKEPTINTVGVDGAVASKHYDVILADDLVDEENSRTKYQRDKMVDWYYKVLSPCLIPPGVEGSPWSEMHHLGTHFHHEDLWNHLSKVQEDGTGGDLEGAILKVPALDPVTDLSPWPERHGTEWIKDKRRKYGIIRFNTQYMLDTSTMKGKIFRYDDCSNVVEDKDLPTEMPYYMGVDLAVEEGDSNDMFAIVVLGKHGNNIYVMDFLETQLRFFDQTKTIIAWAKKWKPVRIAIEVNAYQKSQYNEVKRQRKDLNLLAVHTYKDKISRAHKLSVLFETGRVFFRQGQEKLREHLVLFPDHRYKDLFDALDLAEMATRLRARKKRKKEPGLL